MRKYSSRHRRRMWWQRVTTTASTCPGSKRNFHDKASPELPPQFWAGQGKTAVMGTRYTKSPTYEAEQYQPRTHKCGHNLQAAPSFLPPSIPPLPSPSAFTITPAKQQHIPPGGGPAVSTCPQALENAPRSSFPAGTEGTRKGRVCDVCVRNRKQRDERTEEKAGREKRSSTD